MKNIYLTFLLVLMASVAFSQTIWSEDFEGGLGNWTTIDADGDGRDWAIGSAPAINVQSGTNCAISYSWFQGVALTPNNYLISPEIDLTGVTGSILVDWSAYAQDQTWASEHYQVIAATGNDQASIDAGTVLYDGIVGANGDYVTETGNLSAFAGQVIHIAIVHNEVTDQFALNIDDVIVYTSNTADLGIAEITSPSQASGCTFSDSENITVAVRNFGGSDATDFEVAYMINGGTPVVETVTATVAPAATYEHTFATPVDMSALGEYNITAYSNINDDVEPGNDETSLDVRNSDALITVHVQSDVSGGHSWTLTDNSTGEVVASRGAYQWDIEVFDDICVYSDRCYSFNYAGAMGPGAFLELLLDGVQVAGDTDGNGIPDAINIPAIGGGCSANDASLTALTFEQYALLNTDVTITAVIENLGATEMTELVANYSVDGGTPVSQTFTGLNVSSGASTELSFDTPFNLAQSAVSNVVVTVETVNGEMDDMSNNTQDGDIIPLVAIPDVNFVIEEGTGTWCGWCPRGFVALEELTTNHDDAIAIAVHNADPMDIGSYDSDLLNLAEAPGYPFSIINREYYIDPHPIDVEAAYQAEQSRLVPASLEATAQMDEITRELTVDVTTNIFAIEMKGNYRVNVILTEDGVTGTGADWAQVNFYSGGANGPMGGYENLPDPVPADQMVYDHVARMMMGGFTGDAGSFPTDVTNNDTPTYTYTGQVNAAWDETKMHAIAFLYDMDRGGQIVNAVSTPIEVLVDVDDLATANQVRVYPNPFNDITNIELELEQTQDVTLSIFNSVGQRVAYREYGQLQGEMILPFDGTNMSNGLYHIHIQLGDAVVTKKVMLAR